MRVSSLVRLYPGAWRRRYGDEMEALLEDRRPTVRERLDLLRGALDAWLHPPTPSRVPGIAALVGGGLWTIASAAILAQPVQPDWPGYLLELVPLMLLAATSLFVATAGCLLRTGEGTERQSRVAAWILLAGNLAWIAALAATLLGMVGGALLAAAQTAAMLGAIAVGLLLVRGRDQPIGFLVLTAPVALLVPSTVAWLAFGAAWTAIGVALWVDRETRIGSTPLQA
jgi:hypothetical protein